MVWQLEQEKWKLNTDLAGKAQKQAGRVGNELINLSANVKK